MKRSLLLLMICAVLILSACAGGSPAQNTPPSDPPIFESSSEPASPEASERREEPAPVEPIYIFENTVREKSFTLTDGGEEIASYSYSIPMLRVENEDELSASDREVSQRNVLAFNQEMETVLADAVSFGESLGEDMRLIFEEEEQRWVGRDENVGTATRSGEIITVLFRCYYYGGGAHPNTYSVSRTFDLTLGQFIDPAQIADDPEAFRTGVAALLITQAEGLGEDYTEGFWDDYRDIISNWNDTTVLFDEEGMTVVFSAYELGPYAMGPVELSLSYEDMADVLGSGGLAHLGAAQ